MSTKIICNDKQQLRSTCLSEHFQFSSHWHQSKLIFSLFQQQGRTTRRQDGCGSDGDRSQLKTAGWDGNNTNSRGRGKQRDRDLSLDCVWYTTRKQSKSPAGCWTALQRQRKQWDGPESISATLEKDKRLWNWSDEHLLDLATVTSLRNEFLSPIFQSRLHYCQHCSGT